MLLNINDDIDDNNNIDNDIEYYLKTYVPRLLRGIRTVLAIPLRHVHKEDWLQNI